MQLEQAWKDAPAYFRDGASEKEALTCANACRSWVETCEGLVMSYPVFTRNA